MTRSADDRAAELCDRQDDALDHHPAVLIRNFDFLPASDAVNVLSDKLVFKARLASVAGRDLWHP